MIAPPCLRAVLPQALASAVTCSMSYLTSELMVQIAIYDNRLSKSAESVTSNPRLVFLQTLSEFQSSDRFQKPGGRVNSLDISRSLFHISADVKLHSTCVLHKRPSAKTSITSDTCAHPRSLPISSTIPQMQSQVR